MKKFIPILFFSLLVVAFFWQFFVKGLLPIPSDTIIGLYHPFRDLYAKDYPNGIPFKNSLITDPVRQQYPWRELAITIEKKIELPLWNPYSLSGTPLLANFQSAPFYLFNILFFIMPFALAWSLMIILGPLLGGIFLFLYLNNLRLSKWASALGSISFTFSGFFVSWMEWGTITHVALWLPLILFAIDKIFTHLISQKSKLKSQNSKLWFDKLTIPSEVEGQLKSKNLIIWSLILIISLISSFFAGHLQTFFYLFISSWVYFLSRWIQFGKNKKILFSFIILNYLFIILTSIQWLPTLQFISESARSVDQLDWRREGWFIPWQHLIQFIAPDFFGNPTTLNYWGVWNYGEFIGYIGILPLMMAIFALFFRRDKRTLFYGIIFFLSLIFSFPTIFAKLSYVLKVPFLSTSQPTRLLFIIDFSLAVLAAFGLDYFIRTKKREILYPLVFFSLIIASLWAFVLFGNSIVKLISLENLSVVKNNLIFPSLVFFVSAILIVLFLTFYKTKISTLILCCIIALAVFDLLRFGLKFTPFTKKEYLFPQTETLSFLQKNLGHSRFMTVDSRIFPPNFSITYRLQSVDGYDPLYLLRYGELIAASERKKADINPPFGFNRIITPHNYDSKIIDLLGVKFILSFSLLNSSKLTKAFQEGQTIIYENKNTMPRAFFVSKIKHVNDNKKAIKVMLDNSFNLSNMAVVEDGDEELRSVKNLVLGKVKIIKYSENKVILETENSGTGFLVFTDSFYPTWKAKVNGIATDIYRTDYNFRGVIVPAGRHRIEFYSSII